MLTSIPFSLSALFIATTLLTLGMIAWIIRSSGQKWIPVTIGMAVWLVLQMGISLSGFYAANTMILPPRLLLAIIPPLGLFVWLLVSKRGKRFLSKLSLESLTWLSIVRIPVELALYGLFLYKAIPELMTFAGRNFDIVGGITAPFVVYFGLRKGMLGKKGLLAWNILGLCLLLFIIFNALLSAPTPLQQFGFDQPNIGLLYFPFVWLPAFVAPAVLYSHIISIARLLKK